MVLTARRPSPDGQGPVIPRRLKLRNFLSYRQCDLDFRGLHVALLTGRNGDGKSSLLDAMTWALWGEARGRYEDDRIYLGEDEMLVDFEFELDGDVFQVIRKRTRGKASGALDLFQVDRDGYRMPRSGGTMRETQAEINARLRMDYATFVNSAFIAQGRADEFTRKSPADRKEIFRKILGLEFYEALSVRANDRRKEAETLLGDRERLLGDSIRELEQLPAIEADIAAIQAAIETLEPRLCGLEGRVSELKLAAGAREARERELAAATRQRDALATDVQALESEIAQADANREALLELNADAAEVTAAFERLNALREREHELGERQGRARDVEARMQSLERAVDEERVRLESRRDELGRQLAAAAELAGRLPALREQQQELESERTALADLDRRIEEARQSESALRARAEKARAEAEAHRVRAQEYKDNQARLEGESRCPVCRQPLAPADVERLMEEYTTERRALGQKFRVCMAEADAADREANALATSASALAKERERRDRECRQRESELHRELSEVMAAEEQLPSLQGAFEAVESQLATESFASEPRDALRAARDALQRIDYDPAAHQQLRAQIQELGPVAERYTEMLRARERLAGLQETIARDRDRLAKLRDQLDNARATVRSAEDALAATDDVGDELRRAEDDLATYREEQASLMRRLGSAEKGRDTLRELQARVETTRDEIEALREEAHLFGELREAFGKNGVQALLIDQSLPELERIANDMLERMTGGRIQVRLETQRETKRGTTVETLDIRISDELGTRDYEMYSGGEAFRVDFALRIALSRLLAARAGASLPTLVIDEGFGTQDQEGIDRLVDAINAIQDEFRLILVVTHLEELKERFERRIEVTKDLQRGSEACVV